MRTMTDDTDAGLMAVADGLMDALPQPAVDWRLYASAVRHRDAIYALLSPATDKGA